MNVSAGTGKASGILFLDLNYMLTYMGVRNQILEEQ